MNFSSPNGFMKNATGPIRHNNDGPAILGSAPLRQSHACEAKGPQLDKDFSRSLRSVLLIPTSERSGFADVHRDDGSVWLCVRRKSWRLFWNLKQRFSVR